MKRFVWILVVVLLVNVACVYMAYIIGKRVGGHRATTARAASAVLAFDAAKKVRAGELLQAIHQLEVECFADSVEVLSDVGWRADAFRKTMVPSLAAYRRNYRTNQADWTPAEKELESLLLQKP